MIWLIITLPFAAAQQTTPQTPASANGPPKITVEVPKTSITPTISARVTTTEPINLTITTKKADAKKPPRPTGLTKTAVTNSRVDLSWNSETQATEYLIKRENIIIAKTTQTTYADTTVGPNTQYDYEIIAVNKECTQSDPSASLAVATPGGTNTPSPVTSVKPSCEKEEQTTTIISQADVTINLIEGENIISFAAIDNEGLETKFEEKILYDIAPPQFLEHNLEQLSPSYSPQVVVRGKLSEKGSVTVLVNDKAVETKKTEDDGSFSIPVILERSVQVKTEPLATGLDTGTGYSNKLRLRATDLTGRETTTDSVDIIYAICGFGTDFDVKIASPTPDVLNPRLLYEGLQQVGISFTYEYKGTYNAIVNPSMVRPKLIQLSPAVAKEYDNNLVTPSHFVQGKRGKQNAGEGYIQLTFLPLKDPWTTFALKDKPANPTLYDTEDAISNHRMAYKDLKIKECKTPGVGCVRLFMELEIPYTITTQSQSYLPEQPLTGQTQPQNKVQRTCIDVELAIDRRAPPDAIPAGFLKALSEGLRVAIEGLDVVLKPLRTIYQYLFYTCVAGWFISYVPTFLEQYNCKYQNIASALSGEGKFDEGVATINACKAEYEGNQQSLDNCDTCATWKKNKQFVAEIYKQICDRVACPAAPSLQYYLKTKGTSALTPINAPKAAPKLSHYTSKTGGRLYQGSDCAAWMQQKPREQLAQNVRSSYEAANRAQTSQGKPPIFDQNFINSNVLAAQNAKIPPSTLFTSSDIQGIYQDWMKHKADSKSGDTQGAVNCAAPHPATPECCGYEYMNEWGSACGINAFQGLDTFDEIEESTCLAAQKTNQRSFGEGTQKVDCGGISNALSGFCTDTGTTPLDYIRATTFSGSSTDNTGKLAELGIGKSSDSYLYILLIPSKEGATNYNLRLGYIVEDIEFVKTNQSAAIKEENKYEINSKMKAVELTGYDISQYFSQQNVDNYHEGKINQDVYNKLQSTICSAAGKSTNCDVNGKILYEQVMNKIGKPDQEYIIDPRKGIINAIRCICLPAIISYLQLWRNIMAAVKNCVDTIRFTGDGNPGVCQEMISKYACDLIYEALACFTEKFSAGGGRVGGKDIFGALTSAGTEMSSDIQGRYGQTSTYQAMFTQGQLVKSVCNFAFTGTWSLDFAALADSSIDSIPIESQSFLYPCDRRFVSFNPLTTPPGMTTWVYHFGVFIAAGSDLDIELKLKCSGGYKCDENNGFERGKCDCDTEKTLLIAPPDLPTQAKKDDIVNSAVYYTVAGDPAGTIRYDKAVLTYKWKDGTGKQSEKQIECRINQLGGAPNFCRFDMFSGAYRCQFGPEQGGLQLGNPSAIYAHTIPEGSVYTLNEKINISLPIRQLYTGKQTETKYLEWQILGPGGRMVANNSASLIKLDTNGDYTKSIGPGIFDAPIIVGQNWFGAGTITAPGQQFEVSYWKKDTTRAIPGAALTSPAYYEDTKIYTGAVKYFVIEKQETTYKVYEANEQKTTTANGFTKFEPSNQCLIQGEGVECSFKDAQGKIIPGKKLQFNALTSIETGQAHITIRPLGTGSTGDFCTGDNKYKPATFTMKFTAYEATETGQVSEQVAINPTTNEEARATATFQAVCTDANDEKFKALKGQKSAVACPVGYDEQTTTACLPSCTVPWKKIEGKLCVSGGVCCHAVADLAFINASKDPLLPYPLPNPPIPPGKQEIKIQIPLINKTDLGIFLFSRYDDETKLPDLDEQITLKENSFQNNILEMKGTHNFTTSDYHYLSYSVKGNVRDYVFDIPVQGSIQDMPLAVGDYLLNDIQALSETETTTPKYGKAFQQLAKKSPQSWTDDNKIDVQEKINTAYYFFLSLKEGLDAAVETVVENDKKYFAPIQGELTDAIKKFDQMRTTFREYPQVAPPGTTWANYLAINVPQLSKEIDEVFLAYLKVYDTSFNTRKNFKINSETKPTVKPRDTLTMSNPTRTPWCIYPTGAHYFVPEKCFTQITANFPDYMVGLSFKDNEQKEARGASGTGKTLTFTNPSSLTFERPIQDTQTPTSVKLVYFESTYPGEILTQTEKDVPKQNNRYEVPKHNFLNQQSSQFFAKKQDNYGIEPQVCIFEYNPQKQLNDPLVYQKLILCSKIDQSVFGNYAYATIPNGSLETGKNYLINAVYKRNNEIYRTANELVYLNP